MTTEVSTQNTLFFADIAELLTQARSNSYRSVNSIMFYPFSNFCPRFVKDVQIDSTRV